MVLHNIEAAATSSGSNVNFAAVSIHTVTAPVLHQRPLANSLHSKNIFKSIAARPGRRLERVPLLLCGECLRDDRSEAPVF